MASVADTGNGGLIGFLREALALLRTPGLLMPVLALAVLLTASNIVVASNVPEDGRGLGAAFMVAAFVRVAGLLVLAVAILRTMTRSARPRFRPDAGFWLYALTFVAAAAVSVAVRLLTGEDDSLSSIALGNVVTGVVTAPFAVWWGALAVERPVPWSPAPWLRGLRLWLPHFLFWSLAVVTPLAVLHAAIDTSVVKDARDWFWPLLLFDGPLSTVMALLGLALIAAAYRRVARG
ncbi:MAG TPA: hypothetical protein VGA98_08365 [Allosphingosinicella sp.]|jgi:hypothetical protein